MEKIKKTGENSYIKFLPTYLITIIIPALFGLFLYYLILEIDKNNEIETIKSKLSERATDFMIKTTPLDYFKPHFSNLADKLIPYIESNAKIDELLIYNLSQEIDDFNKKLNINIRCALFKSNSLINEQALEDYEQRFFTYSWKCIHNIENADYKNRIVDQGQILGVDFNPEIMNNYSEYCLPTFSFGKKGLFYFKDSKNKNNGVIIFVEYSKTGLEIIEDKIKDYSTYEQPIIMYDIKSRSIKSSTLGHKTFTYSQINTEEFLDGIINKNILWKCFNSDDYKLLFGQIITQPHKYLYKFIFTSIIALILIVIISFFFFKNVSEKGGLYVSIRYKLIFIFALAIYMPTLSLWVLSHSTINYYRTSIENSVQKGMLDVLNKIDNDYKNKEEEIRDCFYKLDDYLRSFGGKEPPKKEEIEQKLQEIVGKEKKFREIFQWLDIWNINQTQIYTTSDNESNSRVGEISRVIELLCLDKYCPDRLSYAGVKLNQSDIMIGNLLENPISGFSFIFERPRQITFHNFNEIGSYWFWNYYPDKTNPVSFCFGNTDCNDNIVSYFHSISKNRFSLNQTNLLLVNLHFSAQKFIPDTARNWKDLIELISLSNVNKTIEFSTVNYENKKYLCICKPGSLLRGCFSLCLYPTSEIDYQINKVRITIYYVIILLLIIAIFTGLLLAQNFITPIKELNNGLVALQKRETNYTIKIENNDELGQLGNTFNQMMQEIKDMLLAEAIQQCLIPTGEYKKDNYDCVVYNQMAADVGGDYADLFELPENKLLVVIGDVTGHGVSASLLTAMVKASIFNFANQDTPINEMVTNTSNMICDLLNKRKLMTFCAVILNKETGEMQICNAGHPYPIIKEKETGKYRIATKTSLPMGLSKKRCRYFYESEILNNDETLFLYTDGFPEAEDENGEEYGYEKFKQLIANTPITDSVSFKNTLIEVFKQHHKDLELADDITFVIVRRTSL